MYEKDYLYKPFLEILGQFHVVLLDDKPNQPNQTWQQNEWVDYHHYPVIVYMTIIIMMPNIK